MLDPSFLALTRTPSSAPCSALTVPVSGGVCADETAALANNTTDATKLTAANIERRMVISLKFYFLFILRREQGVIVGAVKSAR
jgi:hypothetical protein